MVGVPSSSTFSLPHSFGSVPSSTAVTQGEAICSPSFPQNTLVPKATLVASSPWPHASWKMTPPNPLPMAAGITPDGHTGACSISIAVRAASRPTRAGSTRLSNSSKPISAPGPSKPDWFSVPLPATAWHPRRVYTRRSVTKRPSLLAMSTSCSLSR